MKRVNIAPTWVFVVSIYCRLLKDDPISAKSLGHDLSNLGDFACYAVEAMEEKGAKKAEKTAAFEYLLEQAKELDAKNKWIRGES